MTVYGIDLGTTYSKMAKIDVDGNAQMIENMEEASETLESAVYFESETNVIIGNVAKDFLEVHEDMGVQYIKRYIGELGYQKNEWEIYGKKYSPIEISALMLKRMKQIAEEQGEFVQDVVITCPACFGSPERNAIKKAGELAELHVLGLINESAAAALDYCTKYVEKNTTILVYSLGSGIFDTSLIRVEMVKGEDGTEIPNIVVVDSDGDDFLGGKNWDDALYDLITTAVLDESGPFIEDIDEDIEWDIRRKVECIKKKLSNSDSTKVSLMVNGIMTRIEVTREDFEYITSHLLQKTLSYVDEILQRNSEYMVDTILVVGGSARMPMITEALKSKFPDRVKMYDPETAAAKGAAIYAKYMTSPVCPLRVSASRSLGIRIQNENGEDMIDNLILMGSALPVEAVKTYYTPFVNMKIIILEMFENRSKEPYVELSADGNDDVQEMDSDVEIREWGDERVVLNLPSHTPILSPIEIHFTLDAAGLSVKAVNLATDELIDVTFSSIDAKAEDISLLEVSAM